MNRSLWLLGCLTGIASIASLGCASESLPEAGAIVFSARPDAASAYGWQLFTTGPGGTGTRRLTRTDGDGSPSWSPDGSLVAFARTTEDCLLDACEQIWVVDADGSGERRLTSPGFRAEAPAWSPDGSSIAYVRWLNVDSDRIAETALYVMTEGGFDARLLADGPGWDAAPVWSPDGRRIAFWSDRDDAEAEAGELYVIDADGTNELRLTHTPTDEDYFDWSPDGDEIVVSSDRDGNYDLFVLSADGKGERRLTQTTADERNPMWSPDGHWVAFERQTPDKNALVVIDPETGAERVLSSSPSDDAGNLDVPQSWSPDGKTLAVAHGYDEVLWLIEVEGGPARPVLGAYTEASLGVDWAPLQDKP